MYQGKFTDKSRDPSEAPAQEQAQEKAPAKKRRFTPRTSTLIFYTVYAMLVLGFLAGMIWCHHWLTARLTDYEAAQPTVKCQEVFEKHFRDPDWEALYKLLDIPDTTFEGSEAFARYMEARVGGEELTYRRTSAELTNRMEYVVLCREEPIGRFTLASPPHTPSQIPDWHLDEMELFYEYSHSVQIRKLAGQTVYINGVALDESYTIQIDTTSAEDYLPEGSHDTTLHTQRLEGLLVEPEVSVTDELGNPVEVEYDPMAKLYFTVLPLQPEINPEQENAVLQAAAACARFLTGVITEETLSQHFAPGYEAYWHITSAEPWMEAVAISLGSGTVTEFRSYSQDVFSARVTLPLAATDREGNTRDFTVEATFIFQKRSGKWLCLNLTREDMTLPVSRVRVTFINGDAVISSEFYPTDISRLITPVVSGSDFSGWAILRQGTLVPVFTPGQVAVYTKENPLMPMTLYAQFSNEP